jgi:copper homeostasis protein CutC
MILAMHEAAEGKILIMPGGGIKPETFDEIYHTSIREYHLSGRSPRPSPTPSTLFDMNWAETSSEAIARVVYRHA